MAGWTKISSTQLSANGDVFGGAAHVKSIYAAHSATAGTVVLRTGGSTGTAVCTMNTAAVLGEYQMDIPYPGLRCDNPHITIGGGVSFVTVFYD